MGAIFFAGFMLVLLVFGLAAVIGTSVALIVLRRRDPRPRKLLYVILIAVLVLGILIIALPVGFFGFIVWANSTPPENFVETDIVIEENGYQSDSFTADGVVYQSLALTPGYHICKESAVPVFTYRTEGFLNGSLCGNYYALDNDQGFDLIWSPYGHLFCPTEQAADILAYYHQIDTVWYLIPAEGEPILLDQQTQDALDSSLSDAAVQIPDPDTELWFLKYSADGIVEYDDRTIVIADEKAYIVTHSEVTTDRMLIQYGVPLPDEIGVLFLRLQQY